ncbi:MAG: hypothetical protein Q7R41_17715, partial [Phycisphaerales bacterium]|nr:hypothetical protein [Phycisphaerales bacterium]
AILMGGGLVLFGIGSNVQGGFADFFTGRTSNNSYSDAVNESAKRVAANPENPKAYANLIADRYSYASVGYNEKTQKFDAKSKLQLKMMIDDWKKYKTLAKKIDLNTASYVVNAYIGREDAKGAQKTQTLIAEVDPNSANYLALMRFALYAGDSRVTDASEVKARELATKDQIAQVDREIKRMRKLSQQQNAAIQQQIQEQFAKQQQQQSGSGTGVGSPFGGLGTGAGTGAGK